MCGRYTLHTEKEVLAKRFEFSLEDLAELAPRYNVAPTDPVLTVRLREDARRAKIMRWGLIPHWAKPGQKLPLMINARIETLATRPAYRDAFKTHRCLILADGFYEWQAPVGPGKRKLPHWITLANRAPFAMAGLWSSHRSDDLLAERQYSCTIVTTASNEAVAPIHERMPVILHPEAEGAWLDPRLDGRTDDLLQLLVPVPAEQLRVQPVGFGVNSVKNDDPSLLEPGDDPQLGFS